MARASPRLVASFFGESVASRPAQSIVSLRQAHSCKSKHLLVVSRKLSGLADLLFNRRNQEKEQLEWQHPYARLKCGKVSPRLPVPDHILKPPYVDLKFVPEVAHGTQIHDAEGMTHMRASGQLASRVLDYAGTLVKPGVTTDEIDRAVHEMIIDAGAYPSPLGYGGFPKSVCTSVNECICHGIPDSRPLEDGDIINIDVTVYLNGYHGDTSKTFFCGMVSEEAKQLVEGYHGDTSKTFFCGMVSEEAKQLVEVTEECLHKAIAICGPGVEFKNIGRTINDYADKFHYGVVKDFVGHGVGTVFHSDPVILHFRNNEPGRMVIGQTFTIEPMLTLGSIDHIMWNDNWTVVTADGSLSAQFEHTLLITDDGVEILTCC